MLPLALLLPRLGVALAILRAELVCRRVGHARRRGHGGGPLTWRWGRGHAHCAAGAFLLLAPLRHGQRRALRIALEHWGWWRRGRILAPGFPLLLAAILLPAQE